MGMPSVHALYRHPIKGFNPEYPRELVLTGDGRIDGDRVLAFRFPRGAEPQDQEGLDYWPKGDGLCLRDFPTLARLRLDYDDHVVRLETGGRLLVEADSRAEPERIVTAVVEFLRGTEDADRISRPENGPVTLVGDGANARFQDRAKGYVTLHSRSSLAALEEILGMELDEVRFRSNVSVSGLEPWAENDLIGHRVRIGEVVFDVEAPIGRCLATHANPDNGIRDAAVLSTLTRKLGFDKPNFGVLMVPLPGQEGLRLHVGDDLTDLGTP